jgi:hypothetical protein
MNVGWAKYCCPRRGIALQYVPTIGGVCWHDGGHTSPHYPTRFQFWYGMRCLAHPTHIFQDTVSP